MVLEKNDIVKVQRTIKSEYGFKIQAGEEVKVLSVNKENNTCNIEQIVSPFLPIKDVPIDKYF